MKKLLVTFLILSATLLSSYAQVFEPVKWTTSQKELEDGIYELQFKATIENKWHLYSQFVPDGGPIRTSFVFYDLEGFEFIGKNIKIEEFDSFEEENDKDYTVIIDEPKGSEDFDPNFEMVVKYFDHEALFSTKIKLTTEDPLVVSGYLEFMCCDDSKCLPPSTVDFNFAYNGASLPSAQSTEDGKKPGIEVGTLDLGGETVSVDKTENA
ncbi:MAG: hypothetical protein K8R53_15405, partial [Bacteroidales bacterium]|nr:hypothetical protein [Bacteroidales bacterium]